MTRVIIKIGIDQIVEIEEGHSEVEVLATDIYDNLIRTNSDDAIVDHLNL